MCGRLMTTMASGKYCGVAEMTSTVEFCARAGVWTERRWRGRFDVNWLFVKDIPMSHLRHIIVEYVSVPPHSLPPKKESKEEDGEEEAR